MDELVAQEEINFLDTLSFTLGSTLPLAEKTLRMVVIIPAKNESAEITNALSALAKQQTDIGSLLDTSTFEILVLCHNCEDDTLRKCQDFARENNKIHLHILQLDSERANTVGAARRILMNIASKRLSSYNGFIISTDADTVADGKWLANIGTYLDSEISLVCGFIASNLKGVNGQALTYLLAKDKYLSLKAQLESQLLPDPIDPWPRHNFHWGPNMAIKRDVYKAIGGIKPIHFLEDVDMYYRVLSKGYVVRHCTKTKVTTSTRIDSRCGEGFGAELRVWTDFQGVEYNVEGLDKLLARFKIYQLTQSYYEHPCSEILLEIFDLSKMEIGEIQSLLNQPSKTAAKMEMEQFLNKSAWWQYTYPNTSVLAVVEELNNYFTISCKQNRIPIIPFPKVPVHSYHDDSWKLF